MGLFNRWLPAVFVVGVARSGTSILGELLGSHPAVDYYFELHTMWQMYEPRAEHHRALATHASREVTRAIREELASKWHRGKILVEKNPRNILRVPYVKTIFPRARFIHIVRDGRDVACSLVPGCGGDVWGHLKPPNWRKLQSEYHGVVRCAHIWKTCIELGLEDLESTRHLQVRYEDLVAAPRAEAGRLFAWLGLSEGPETAAFCEKIQDETRDSYHASRQEVWFRPDHQRRVGRWRENLTDDEQDAVEEVLSPTLSRLGY